MNSPIAEAESLLAIDIGTIHTRALLFDIVDGQYRFLGASRAPSTHGAPFYDISEGIFQALQQLQTSTGHIFIADSTLILPGRTDGSGIDALVLTFTAGPSLRIAVLGVLEDVSVESARRLASSTQSILVEAIGLNDSRKQEVQIDAILRARPDLIVIAGGTDRGATRSLGKITDLVSTVLQLTPESHMPEIIFAGNQSVEKHVSEVLSRQAVVHTAPNIRPSIDQEILGPAQDLLANTVAQIRAQQLGGLQSYFSVAAAEPLPSSYALGRLVRFLSQINSPGKDVLAIDLGASNTTLAAAREGKLDLSVYPTGMGAGLALALQLSPLASITRWLPMPVPDDLVRDYLWQKTLFPASVPATPETLAIEQAAARQILQLALRTHQSRYQKNLLSFEPMIAAGAALTEISPGKALLTLLDGLQPVGTSTFVLDPYGLAAALGIAARVNSILPVQVVESNAFLNLGTVISPVSRARHGEPLLKVHLEQESGEEGIYEVAKGSILRLPVLAGHSATIHLEMLRQVEIDQLRKGANPSYQVTGGACGVVIDARSRPISLPSDAAERRELLSSWDAALSE